jgi:hypothetical protein
MLFDTVTDEIIRGLTEGQESRLPKVIVDANDADIWKVNEGMLEISTGYNV